MKGFQAEIDPEKDAGGLYETSGRAWVVQPKPEDVKKWFKPGQWNEMSVVAIGRHVVVQVNGRTSAELIDDPGIEIFGVTVVAEEYGEVVDFDRVGH